MLPDVGSGILRLPSVGVIGIQNTYVLPLDFRQEAFLDLQHVMICQWAADQKKVGCRFCIAQKRLCHQFPYLSVVKGDIKVRMRTHNKSVVGDYFDIGTLCFFDGLQKRSGVNWHDHDGIYFFLDKVFHQFDLFFYTSVRVLYIYFCAQLPCGRHEHIAVSFPSFHDKVIKKHTDLEACLLRVRRCFRLRTAACHQDQKQGCRQGSSQAISDSHVHRFPLYSVGVSPVFFLKERLK